MGMTLDDLAVFLDGERVCLCPLRRDDADIYAKWLTNPKLSNLLGVGGPVTIERELEFLDSMLTADPGKDMVLGIWDKERVELIGNVGLHQIDGVNQHAMAGIFIGDEANWGKQYGSEAMRLMLDYVFHTMNLRKVWLHCFGHNERAYTTYQKMGFKEVGRHKDHTFRDGDWVDYIIMEVFRNEFYNTNYNDSLK